MTILTEIKNIQRWNEQTRAIAHHLERYGALYKAESTRGSGIPGYGIIEHPAARILDLRQMGWKIRTELHPTRWVLESKPDEQLPLPI